MTPLTAMKFAELSVKAGFPPGVISILPGKGKLFFKYSDMTSTHYMVAVLFDHTWLASALLLVCLSVYPSIYLNKSCFRSLVHYSINFII